MEDLVIQKTMWTPQVNFRKNGDWLIKGVSNGNNTAKFYEDIMIWIEGFKKTKPPKINLIMEMEYMNTASALSFVRLLKALQNIKLEGCQLNVAWRYEEQDEDLLDLGQHLSLATSCEVEYSVINRQK